MKERKPFTTSLNSTILKDVKKLAIDLDRGINDILEEAMKDILKKYENPSPKRNNAYQVPIKEYLQLKNSLRFFVLSGIRNP